MKNLIISISNENLKEVRDKIANLITKYISFLRQSQMPVDYDIFDDYDFIYTKLKFEDITERVNNDPSKQNKE